MIFACHNLKRMARWSWKTSSKAIIKRMITAFLKPMKLMESDTPFWSTTLSTV